MSVLEELITELQEQPEKVQDFVAILDRITGPWEEKMSVLEELITELQEQPEKVQDFVAVLDRIAGPWEEFGQDGLGGFFMRNVLGREIASLTKDYPRWRVVVDGEVIKKDVPIITRQTKSNTGKLFAERLLQEKGYFVRSSEE